jgi:hypothetical protein
LATRSSVGQTSRGGGIAIADREELPMAVTSELDVLHRTVDDLRNTVASLRTRYGDIPAVRRLTGDVDRLELDVADLDDLPAPSDQPPPQLQVIDDRPLDPGLWADADDEGLGGYHGGRQ